MVEQYGIKNFRKYRKNTEIKLNRLNIFLGENNIGKSSFIRTIPMLQQTYDIESNELEWYGSLVDLESEGMPNEYSFTIKFDKGIYRGLYINRLMRSEYEIKKKELDDILIKELVFNFKKSQLITLEVKGYGTFIHGKKEIKFKSLTGEESLIIGTREYEPNIFESNFRRHRFDDEIEKNERELLVYQCIQYQIQHFLRNTSYISGNRTYGERFHRNEKKKITKLSASGDNLMQLLNSIEPRRFSSLNEYLKESFDFEIVKPKKNRQLSELKLLICGREYNIIDLGSGYSQILPILIELFISQRPLNQNKLIIIEQPEIHLHPKLVKKLISIIYGLCSKNSEIQFIIETHSSDIIYELGNEEYKHQQVEKKARIVSVFNVEEDKDGDNVINEYGFDEDGFINWPRNFLE